MFWCAYYVCHFPHVKLPFLFHTATSPTITKLKKRKKGKKSSYRGHAATCHGGVLRAGGAAPAEPIG
jgi:hypothetical protein